jgi:GntR family transcriptional regulator, rspAB operon transcriptional repressor
MDDVVTTCRADRPDRGRTSAGHVFDVLRDEIVSLKLKPGAALSRVDLQERFRMSSTPIRDALMRLEDEHLVDIFPQHATLVSVIDLELAREAQFLRRSVEIEIVTTLCAGCPAEVIDRLRRLIRQQQAFADLAEHQPFAAADQLFHRTLFQTAGVAALWHLVRRRSGHIDRLRHLHLPVAGKMREIVAAHTAIVDAVEARRADAAQVEMREHLSRSLDFVPKLKERFPEYFAA